MTQLFCQSFPVYNYVSNEKVTLFFTNRKGNVGLSPPLHGTPVHASHPGARTSVPRPQVSAGWSASCPLNALAGVWLFVVCQPSQDLAVWMNQRPTVGCNMVRILWTIITSFLSTEEDVSIFHSGHCTWKKCPQVYSELYISNVASWCFDPWEWNIIKCMFLPSISEMFVIQKDFGHNV